MNPARRQHFLRVARQMNNYVAVTSHYYYRTPYYPHYNDRANFLSTYQTPSLTTGGLGGLLAYGLGAIGMPTSVVNFGYRIGYFLDSYS